MKKIILLTMFLTSVSGFAKDYRYYCGSTNYVDDSLQQYTDEDFNPKWRGDEVYTLNERKSSIDINNNGNYSIILSKKKQKIYLTYKDIKNNKVISQSSVDLSEDNLTLFFTSNLFDISAGCHALK